MTTLKLLLIVFCAALARLATAVIGRPGMSEARKPDWDGWIIMTLPSVAILCGCAGLTVTPPVEIEHTAVEWTEDVGPWFSVDTTMTKYEIGLRSDGVMVWRTAQPAQDEAEAMRQWREFEARKLEQHGLDRGVGWKNAETAGE